MDDYEKDKKMSEIIETLKKNNPGITDRQICEQLIDSEHLAKWEKHFIDCTYFLRNEKPYENADPDDDSAKWQSVDNFMDYIGVMTYDAGLSHILAKRYIPVIESIIARRTFEFIAVPQQYEDFIIAASFLYDRNLISYGCSIRGAWFDSLRHAKTPGPCSYDGSPVVESSYSVTQLFLALVHFTRKHGQLDS